jgi:hypothetical protein
MEGLEWIKLVQDLDKWQAVVSTVMNLQIHTVWGLLNSEGTAGW